MGIEPAVKLKANEFTYETSGGMLCMVRWIPANAQATEDALRTRDR